MYRGRDRELTLASPIVSVLAKVDKLFYKAYQSVMGIIR